MLPYAKHRAMLYVPRAERYRKAANEAARKAVCRRELPLGCPDARSSSATRASLMIVL